MERASARLACEKLTSLPGLAAENAAWSADVSLNVAHGLKVSSCLRMAADAGPLDLFDNPTFVACDPPRFCSVGPDGVRKTTDDACTPLVEGDATGRRTMRAGWSRRFLQIDPEMRPGCESADAAVVHFYAALMRRDGSHLAALPPAPAWDDTLRRKMAKHDRFHFLSARLQGLRCSAPTACDFEVWLRVASRPGGPGSSGRDQGVVVRGPDGWAVTRPPT
jgi:hypothetical protein